MTTKFNGENSLTIQLLSYDNPNGKDERYYFLGMSTLQATTLLFQTRKIISSKIVAYTDDDKYLDDQTKENLKTIGDFNDFFKNNPDYYIHDCEIELENGTILTSHDDGEVSIKFPKDSSDQLLIDTIFDKYNLDKTLIQRLKNNPGHYLAIDRLSNLTGDFENFDDFVKKGRKV